MKQNENQISMRKKFNWADRREQKFQSHPWLQDYYYTLFNLQKEVDVKKKQNFVFIKNSHNPFLSAVEQKSVPECRENSSRGPSAATRQPGPSTAGCTTGWTWRTTTRWSGRSAASESSTSRSAAEDRVATSYLARYRWRSSRSENGLATVTL